MFKNKSWKTWKTRKTTFIYMLAVGTAAIIYGAVLQAFSIDVTGWLELVLNFCKFVVGTGTVIVLVPSVKDLTNFILRKDGIEVDEEEESDDDEEAAG